MIALVALVPAASADDGNPWGDVLGEEPATPPAPEPVPAPASEAEEPPPVEPAPEEPEAELRPAPPSEARGVPMETWRIEPVGPGSGLMLSTGSVLGGDGATTAFTARTRLSVDDVSFTLTVPFATWRTADGRDAGLGNLAGSLFVQGHRQVSWGIVAHVPLGQTYTWVNEAEELWTGTGADAVVIWQRLDTVSLLARGSAGLHFTPGYDPVPTTFFKVSGTAAVDVALHESVGVSVEGSMAWWDVSPLDLAGLVRFDPTDEVRLRGGLVFPLASWVGVQPAPVPAGVREATLRLDVIASF